MQTLIFHYKILSKFQELSCEKDSMPYFSMFPSYISSFESSGLNCEFTCREYGFSINSEISFISLGDEPILTLKISVTNFRRFRYFADFDIKILPAG